MKKEKNKTNKILIILGILIGILSLLGISYAIWVLKLNQTNFNIVNSSCLKLNLINEKNDINIENAYPLLNEEGKSLTPYEFTIENTCDLFVSYSVNLEVLDETTLPIKYVSVLLNEEGVQRLSNFDTVEATLKNISISKELYKGGIGAGETNNYKLRLWLSEDVGPEDTDAMNKIFTSKVTVTASAGIYDPLKQGYDKISDAILANEYQTSPTISKQKIASKQSPDFSKTAPLIIWNENKSDSLESITAIMPHPDLVALKDTDERFKNLTSENVLLTIGTGYTFNKDTGKYDLVNTNYLDPTTLNYNGNTKYYYCDGGYVTSQNDVIKPWRSSSACTRVYEINSVTFTDEDATGLYKTTFKVRKYNLSVYTMMQVESESDKSDKGLYKMEDDDGISYYYRGSVNNNYVKFAGYYWRIIRINGDKSVRLLYAGDKISTSGLNLVTKSGMSFNNKKDNPAYAGYMYGNTLNVSYENTTANEVDSTIKTELDNWYKEKIVGTNYENNIASASFCNDRRIYNGDGFSNNTITNYMPYKRVYESKTPDLKCMESNNMFTTSISNKGNKALTYPVGLITADELMLSGYADGFINRASYTYCSYSYWTMTPRSFNTNNQDMHVFALSGGGYILGTLANASIAIRPVINILGDSKISGGIGTKDNPYQISVG